MERVHGLQAQEGLLKVYPVVNRRDETGHG